MQALCLRQDQGPRRNWPDYQYISSKVILCNAEGGFSPANIEDGEMPIRESLHQSADETSDGNKEQRRFSPFSVSVGTGQQSTRHGASLHGRNEISGKVGDGAIRTLVQAELSVEDR